MIDWEGVQREVFVVGSEGLGFLCWRQWGLLKVEI